MVPLVAKPEQPTLSDSATEGTASTARVVAGRARSCQRSPRSALLVPWPLVDVAAGSAWSWEERLGNWEGFV
jgi:hypothetical protein